MYRVGYFDRMDVFQVLCYHHNLLSVIDHLKQYADEVCVNGRLYGFEHQGTRFSVVYVPED